MAKALKDILAGKKASKVVPGSTGSDPGVDYAPKAPNEQEFVKKHSVEKHEDRAGNGDDVFQATNIKHTLADPKEKKHGYKKPEDKKVNEAKEQAKCNMTEAGTACPVHEMADCSKQKTLKEVLTKKTPAGDIIKDFQKSKDPKFAGKSAEERKRMALGAYYGMHPEKSKTNEEIEQIDELDRQAGSVINRYISKTTDDPKRKEGRDLALKKKWGDKTYGLPEPKVKAVTREEVEQVDEAGAFSYGKKPPRKGSSAHFAAQKQKEHDKANPPIEPKDQKVGNAKVTKEDLAVPLLGGDDESAEMAKTQLRALANKALHLAMQLNDDQVVEPWVQSKIAVAKDHVTAVHDYMIYGDHSKDKEVEQTSPYEGGIDMSSGTVTNTFPNFSVDVNTGRNV